MAIFTIQTPDGRKLRIEAADEATALRGAQEWAASNSAQPQTAPQSMEDRMWQSAKDLAAQSYNNRPQPSQMVEGNPYRSSLPGILGDFQNTSTAFQRGAAEGMTANFSNEITAGLLAVPNAIGAAVQGQGFDIGQGFNDAYSQGNEMAAQQQALNPAAAGAGHVTGSLALGSSLGGLSPMSRATTPLGMAGMGALEGGAYGAAYGLGGAEGADRVTQALIQGGQGAVGGAVTGPVISMFTPQVSKEARFLNRGLERDAIDPATVQARMQAIGPGALPADIGTNLQAQTAAIATLPGSGAKTVVDALAARRASANPRIRQDVTAALGTPPRPSQVTAEIDAAKDALSPVYQDVLRQKALSIDPFIDSAPVVNAIDGIASRYVGGTRREIERARDLLIDPATQRPIQDPALLLAARQELDGVIGQETNATTQAALVEARRLIDESLTANVPGIKQVDAQFQDLARQQEANTRGQTVLRDGVTQVGPEDLAEEIAQLYTPSGVNVGPTQANARRLEQGLVSDINRVIGQGANDRVKLRNLIRGEGSWNYDNIALVLGKDKADELMAILNREAKFAETENLATSGSRTQVLRAAQEDVNTPTDPGILREALNFQYGNAAAKMADSLLGGAIAKSRDSVTSRVAAALVNPGGLSDEMINQIYRIRNGLPQKDRALISALLAGQAAQ